MTNILDIFKNITGYDLRTFFQMYVDFTSTYYDGYVGYYRGLNDLDRNAVNMLDSMIKESNIVEELFDLNKEFLSKGVDAQILYDDFCAIKVKIETIKSTPKWMRSSYISDYDKNITTSHILKQNQTLEALSFDLGYNTPENNWTDIAINNALLEVDYSGEGGNNLKATLNVNDRIDTVSVVDIMIGDNVLGKDITTKLQIIENDIEALDPKSTLFQASSILIGLKRGSVPEFPQDGLSPIIGSNLKSFNYPIIFRQLSETFKKDDTFKELEVVNIDRDQDNAILNIRIVSKLNDVLNKGVYING